MQGKDRGKALRDLTEAVRLPGANGSLASRAEADRGRVLHLQERFREAADAYDAALKADPGRIDVLRWRGEVLLAQHRYAEAAAAFDAYLDRGGASSSAIYRQRGLARAKLGRHAESIDDYGRALDAENKVERRAALHLSRAQEYLSVNALQPALRDFENARRLQPNSADASLGCAHVRVKLGELPKATEDTERALCSDPQEPRLWHGAAHIYVQAAALLKAEPGREDVQALVHSHYLQRAVALLQRALQLVPADERPAYWRDKVRNDAALRAIEYLPQFLPFASRYDGRTQ